MRIAEKFLESFTRFLIVYSSWDPWKNPREMASTYVCITTNIKNSSATHP